jgi:hypothetical protein
MGNSFSKREETPAQKRKRLQETHGVLIPPTFVVGNSFNVAAMPLSTQAMLKQQTSPCLMNYLWGSNPGRRLLEEHMTPGIYLSVPTSSEGHILVALNTASAAAATTSNNTPKSFVWAGQTHDPFKMELYVPTANQQPSLQVSGWPSKSLSLIARLSPDTTSSNPNSWVEGKYKTTTKDGMDVIFGSWITLDSLKTVASRTKKLSKASSPTLHVQAVAEYQQSLVAAHAKLQPYNTNGHPPFQVVSTMLSLNLNDPKTQQPPLWLTCKQEQQKSSSNSGWTLNLSQILTFDRSVLNVLEDRAPLVRQTLGWVVQVENAGKQDYSDNKNKNDITTQWSVGATWQWNRALAVKGVVCDNGQTLKYGGILKRWNQPRVTLSILNSLDLATAKHSFLGFGLELETTALIVAAGSANTADYQDDNLHIDNRDAPVPPTKIQIPKDINTMQ